MREMPISTEAELFWVGTVVRLWYVHEGEEFEGKFMLVENFEDGFVFQLVWVEGYHSGQILAYIAEDESAVRRNAKAVTWGHLMKEFKRVVGESVKVLEVIRPY